MLKSSAPTRLRRSRGPARRLVAVRSRALLLAGAAIVCAGSPAAARAASLPAVASGVHPGPDLLYAPPADAPQLQNVGVWKAPPILVSGAESYRGGEFLYQDFLYDDHGGAGPVDDPNDPFTQGDNAFAAKHGTLSYPTDTATFANNAADLVELRVKPLSDATAFRVTLNTLKAPERVAFTIALGDSPGSVPLPWPHGAGVVSPAQLFLTVHGTSAELINAASGTAVAPAPTATIDLQRRQVEVRIPHQAWNPGNATVRMASGVGLWNTAANSYLKPGPTATATTPGGASPSGAAFFNMAFRTDEPMPRIYDPGVANTIAEGHVGVVLDGSYWRERRQGDVLATGNVTPFAAQVDFAKLHAQVRDDSRVPQSGHIDRIFASHSVFGQGVDYTNKCIAAITGAGSAAVGGAPTTECSGRQVGQLQPYALYVPHKPVPAKGFGLVLSMHGLSANYNEFLGSHEAAQFGERGTGSILASPEGRGPDGFYQSYAEADTFEMWADVARQYPLNPDLTDVSGYSMGGFGTYRLATRWPDLFARAFPIVGPPTSPASFASLRNVPVMAWYGQTDELVPPTTSEQAFLFAQQSGLRYDHWVFTPAGHITEGNNDEYGPAAAFLGDYTVERDPAHVTYALDPSQDTKALSAADHAYWVSALKLRAGGTPGKIDARSHASGFGDPPVLAVKPSVGTLNGGSHGPLPYSRRTTDWGPAPAEPRANELDVSASNLSEATIDARRAGVGCDAKVNVRSDGPLKLTLAGCNLTRTVTNGVASFRSGRPAAACSARRNLTLRLAKRLRRQRVRSTRVYVNGKRQRVIGPRKHRYVRISLAGLKRGPVRVRIVSRLFSGRRVTTRRTYWLCSPRRKHPRRRHHRAKRHA